MLGLRGLERRGAAALGATATVSLTRWCTEQSAAKVTPGKAVGALESLVATRKPVFVPQQRSFSTQTSKVADIAVDSIAAPSKPSSSFVAWYEGHLQANPVPTKMVTGSILWGLGDLVAQVVPQMAAESSADNSDFVYDYARTGRAVTFGGLIHAPTSHLHFNLLEWMTVKTGAKGLQITVFKTIMEQFVYWSWISNSMYHGAMGAMQGLTLQQIYDRIADVLWDTQKAQWAFWIPVQLVNFNFTPVRHQLNVVLVTSIAWTALLSVWYPPVKEEKPEVEA